MFDYPVTLTPDGDTLLVTFADVPEAITFSALESAKLGQYQAMTEQGVRKAELARRLGWHVPQVDRRFELPHASKLD